MHAWNYGRRIAEGGWPPPSVEQVHLRLPLPLWNLTLIKALDRLGEECFHHWANRGWWAAHTSKESA